MDRCFLLLLIFVVSHSTYALPLQPSTVNYSKDPCISFQLRGVPVRINETKNKESYLNVKVGDDLRVLFNSCNQSITCVIYKNNEPSTTLAIDSHNSDRIIMHALHDSIRCSNPNGDLMKFHIFAQEQGKFFKKAIIDETAEDLTLSCFGGVYTTNVKLIENDNELDDEYDPLYGFTLDKTKHPPNHFYQCQFENERISFDYPDFKENSGFEMRTIKYTTSMLVQCEANENFISSSNTTVILACPNRKQCPMPTLQTTFGLNDTYSAHVQLKNPEDSDAYKCVFLRNGNIEAIAHDKMDQSQVTSYVVNLLQCGTIIAVIFCMFNILCRLKENKKKDNKFGTELLLDSTKLGKGHSSTILLTKYKKNGKLVVIKCLQNPSQCQKELYFFKKARHVNIIDPLGYIQMPTTNRFFNRHIKSLVLPYYQNHCLEKYIKQFYPVRRIDDIFYGKNIDENDPKESTEITITLFDMISIGWQVAAALEHLKKKKITHRDVAMRNVLINNNMICKLTDFERAKKGETEKITIVKKLIYSISSNKKTIPTMYPKECAEGAYYYGTEVYCFGLLLLEMFQFVKSVNHGKRNQPMHCPSNIFDIIQDCLKSDRRQRIEIGKCESELKFAARQLNEEKFSQLEKRLKYGEENYLLTPEESDCPENSDYKEFDIGLFD